MESLSDNQRQIEKIINGSASREIATIVIIHSHITSRIDGLDEK